MTTLKGRMAALATLIDPDSGEKEKTAELNAYAAGISVVQSDFEQLEKELSFENPQGHTLDLLANMFCADNDMTADEKRTYISERFKEVFGDYVTNALENLSEEYSGITVVFLGMPKRYVIRFGSVTESGLIDGLGKILKNYFHPSHYVVIYDGDGMDFDWWDASKYDFNAYERLDLPFYVLDQMN